MPRDLKFGISLSHYDLDPAAFGRLVEDAGFDSLWLGEHIANSRPLPAIVPMLGALAATTRRVSIGSSVLLLPLHRPVIVAKELATIDLISRGRLIVGVGVGGENPAEYAACEVPLSERFGRANEMLDIVRSLWRRDGVSFEGKHFRLEDVTIEPKPVQAGGPPIYVGGRSEGAMRRAVRYAQGFMPYLYSPEHYARAASQVSVLAADSGRDMAGFAWALCLGLSVGDRAEARRWTVAAECGNYGEGFEPMVDKFCVFGTPDDCLARLREYVDAGARHFVFRLDCPQEMFRQQLRTVATEIVPRLRG